ncbi:MAG: M20/M25/M40 family metallo-hydrolase [Bacteroidetes bacterium]|nr:M20/M25/M40 family metallo-hydrolase [Bacteroidota bacterium]
MSIYKNLNSVLFLILFFGNISKSQTNFNEKLLKSHIAYLASDELKGRGTSTKEEILAANYIASYFKKIGLKELSKQYIQEFSYKVPKGIHDTSTASSPLKHSVNVAGFIDAGMPHTVIVGAHFDHLGLGFDHNSLEANPENKIHNGADDNASGVAGVLELAHYFSIKKSKLPFNMLFICFSGEELGLIGSKKYCENPLIANEKINYMINLDMIGRLNDSTKKLMIYGVGTSNIWVNALDSVNKNFNFQLKKDSSGVGPSDQTSFYLKNIPVLHFFTGQHHDYHKPSDDIEKINLKGEVAVLEFTAKLIESTFKQAKLNFLKTRIIESSKSSFKVTLGIMPDYSFDGKGVRVDGVTDNKPAAIAGVVTGDVIKQLGEIKIVTMEDYMKALGRFNKGEETSLKVERRGKIIDLMVRFK